MIVIGVGSVLLMLDKISRRSVEPRRRAGHMSLLSFSLEWAIDGRRKSSLAEYGRFVGVL